jgi:ABC-2 type transport system permease protein
MFGGAIHAGPIPYVDYLVPGFVATGVLFEQGFVDRLRSVPIPRSSVLAARVLADTATLALSAAVTVAIAFAAGFRLHGTAFDGLAAFGPVIAFGFVFEWLFATMGLLARTGRIRHPFTVRLLLTPSLGCGRTTTMLSRVR